MSRRITKGDIKLALDAGTLTINEVQEAIREHAAGIRPKRRRRPPNLARHAHIVGLFELLTAKIGNENGLSPAIIKRLIMHKYGYVDARSFGQLLERAKKSWKPITPPSDPATDTIGGKEKTIYSIVLACADPEHYRVEPEGYCRTLTVQTCIDDWRELALKLGHK